MTEPMHHIAANGRIPPPEKTILQIIPADGWAAIYFLSEPPYYSVEPLAAWALVEENTAAGVLRGMEGLDASDFCVDFVEGVSSFYVYAPERLIDDDLKAEWAAEGKRRTDSQKEKKT